MRNYQLFLTQLGDKISCPFCFINKYLCFAPLLSCSVFLIRYVSCLDKGFSFWAGWSPDIREGMNLDHFSQFVWCVTLAANYRFTYFCCLSLMFASDGWSLASSSICFHVVSSLYLFFPMFSSSSKLCISSWLFCKYNSVVSKRSYLRTKSSSSSYSVNTWLCCCYCGKFVMLKNANIWKELLLSVPFLALVIAVWQLFSFLCCIP